MIRLDKIEQKLILLCKGWLNDQYPFKGKWVETLKPIFFDIYGWDPDEPDNYRDYLTCIFDRLLTIQLKISDDQSGYDNQLRGIFQAAFKKSFVRNDELPIERAISELCGLIQCNKVTDEFGNKRYEIN